MQGFEIENSSDKEVLKHPVFPGPMLAKARFHLEAVSALEGSARVYGTVYAMTACTNVANALLIHLGEIRTIGEFKAHMARIDTMRIGEFETCMMSKAMTAIEEVLGVGSRRDEALSKLSTPSPPRTLACERSALLELHAGFAEACAKVRRLGDQLSSVPCHPDDVEQAFRLIEIVEGLVEDAITRPQLPGQSR